MDFWPAETIDKENYGEVAMTSPSPPLTPSPKYPRTDVQGFDMHTELQLLPKKVSNTLSRPRKGDGTDSDRSSQKRKKERYSKLSALSDGAQRSGSGEDESSFFWQPVVRFGERDGPWAAQSLLGGVVWSLV